MSRAYHKAYSAYFEVKQEILADMMGNTQVRIPNCEQKKVLGDEVIDKLTKALNIAPQLIKEIENNTFGKR